MGKRLNYDVKGKVAHLTINRPEKKNALDDVAIAEIAEYFGRASSDDNIRAIVFRGAGSAFSAGADLEYLRQLTTNDVAANFSDSSALKDVLLDIYTSRKLVCAVVRGSALAGGFGLVLACDLVFASEKAKFGLTEVKIGFVPAIVVHMALRKLRESDVRSMALTGKIIDASEAVRTGLIGEVFDDAKIEEDVEQFLDGFVKGTSKSAIELTKEVISEAKDKSLAEALRYGAQMNARARGTKDFQKGIDSFLNKKKLEWE